MAQCVSCGRAIAAGKFFCDECLKQMKGKRGSLKEVESKTEAGKAKAVEGKISQEIEPGEGPDQGAEAPSKGVGYIEKQLRSTLTPTAGKKVIALKPGMQESADGKQAGQRKKFKITITLSERSYRTLSRLKLRKKDALPTVEGDEVVTPKESPKPRKKRSLYGRPKLKAVSGISGRRSEPEKGIKEFIAYRDRRWDKGDLASAIMATAAMVFCLVIVNLGWVRITWSEAEGVQPRSLTINGIDLGAPIYVIIVLVCTAWLYMILTRFLHRAWLGCDFGLVLMLVGIIFIIIFFVTISSNDRILGIVAGMIGKGENYFGQRLYSYQRQTLWSAYIMVFIGSIFAFSGLIRLSERRKEAAGEEQAG
ncbi:MAG: hypothetical protein SWK76_09070 [Actinomycetota bacterium]|nr:hypothetical protein [Actinomycetota bacterium]